ncbi:MAG: hypothetical protein IOD12_04045 [Silvanigrellales bacterium]|nr:hypothetical protein [Silvanigrellales bacterium]
MRFQLFPSSGKHSAQRATACGLFFMALLLGCASNVPPADPLADEEFGRQPPGSSEAWQTPPSSSNAPQRQALEPQQREPAVPPAGVLLRRSHRPHHCQDGGRWRPSGNTYRQGCLRCTCVADETSQRIECRELKSCRKSAAQKP